MTSSTTLLTCFSERLYRSGTPLDPECNPAEAKLSSEASCYLIIDTNVALHQHPGIEDVIVPSIVLQELRHRNKSVYDRLRNLTDASSNRRFFVFLNEHHRSTYVTQQTGESDNDRNDRAIRVASKWYADLLKGKMEVVLLTNDVNNRYRAETEMGLNAQSVVSYAKSRTDCTELYDIALRWIEDDAMDIDDKMDGKHKKQSREGMYSEHLPLSELQSGIHQGIYHQGTISMQRHCWYCGMVNSESYDSPIKVIGAVHINRAISGIYNRIVFIAIDRLLKGDVVVVQLLSEEDVSIDHDDGEEVDDHGGVQSIAQDFGDAIGDETGAVLKYPLGKVVGILKRNIRTAGYCGSIKQPKSQSRSFSSRVVFVPKDHRFPPILIRTSQVQELIKKRIIVAIDEWTSDSRLPFGHYVRKIGDIGDKNAETEALLFDRDVNSGPFTPAVHACVPPLPWSVADSDLLDPNRRDLRDLCIFSIDPPGCKDIDDALHVRSLSNGNFEIGVHIADVTHFLQPDSALDVEATKRSTTVYLVQTSISMLPRPLTEEICSLKSDVDRLAFSVLWELTPKGDLLPEKTVFAKSVIRSRASLSYSEAQTRIDDLRLQDEITQNLRLLNRFGKIFRSKRKEKGALELASAEIKFQIDSETQDPTDIAVYRMMDTNRLVEEFMLLANTTVAQKILEHFPLTSCLRRHPEPEATKFKPLIAALETREMTLDLKSNETLSDTLDKAIDPDDPYFNTLVRMMTTRHMTEAVYFVSGKLSPDKYYHYGLAMDLYTHFTSPIRRYADVLVHRLLSAAIGLNTIPRSFHEVDTMQNIINNLNYRHRNAQLASRDSASLYTILFFRNKKTTEIGWVTGFTGVKKMGLTVFVQKYGIEGPVFRTVGYDTDSGFLFKSSTEAESKASRRIYRIFDRVQVVIEISSRNDEEELILSLNE